MATDQPNDLTQFYQFLGEQIGRGTEKSPEDLLVDWRDSHPAEEDDELVADIRLALDDLAAGDRGVPADEFFGNFRRECGISDE